MVMPKRETAFVPAVLHSAFLPSLSLMEASIAPHSSPYSDTQSHHSLRGSISWTATRPVSPPFFFPWEPTELQGDCLYELWIKFMLRMQFSSLEQNQMPSYQGRIQAEVNYT
jgi:hypothetical protein